MTVHESNLILCENIKLYFQQYKSIKEWVFYGAGSCAEHAINHGFIPKLIIDSDENKWGTNFLGEYTICSLQELKNQFGTTIPPMLITSTYAPEIGITLKKHGIDLYFSYLHISGEHFGTWSLKGSDNEKVRLLNDILFDKESKDILQAIVFKRNNFITDHKDICIPNQYFLSEILKPLNNEVYVDCGAFEGDTIDEFLKWNGGTYKEIYAFEIDVHNYNILRKNYEDSDSIYTLNYGCWDKEEDFSYTTRAGGRGSVAEEGSGNTCKCIPIAKCIESEVTLLKMDIEGAEIRALIGAKEIILKYKPRLAICVYHKPDDLWEIPFWIHDLVPEYKLYLRHHAENHYETVIYATCEYI